MAGSEFYPRVVVQFGPIEVTETVIYSLIVSAILVALALAVRAGLAKRPTSWQIGAEFLVEHFEGVMRDMFNRDPQACTPLVVTLALFIGTANLLGLVPGLRADCRFFDCCGPGGDRVSGGPLYGIRARGLGGYLKHYVEPTPWLLPLEIISEFSRTLALAVRLFGNIVSEELVIAVLLGIAGLFVPVPIMMLAVLTSLVQAYIFAVLAVVYLSAAVRTQTQ